MPQESNLYIHCILEEIHILIYFCKFNFCLLLLSDVGMYLHVNMERKIFCNWSIVIFDFTCMNIFSLLKSLQILLGYIFPKKKTLQENV